MTASTASNSDRIRRSFFGRAEDAELQRVARDLAPIPGTEDALTAPISRVSCPKSLASFQRFKKKGGECPYRKSDSDIFMMQSAKVKMGGYPAYGLNLSRPW